MHTDTTVQQAGPPTRTRRSELLAAADAALLVELAQACLEDAEDLELVREPEVGMLMLSVREPVETTRFHLGDVLVTQSEVIHRGVRAWSMRMGDDRLASLAAAILDAEVESGGRYAGSVLDLCEVTQRRVVRERADEWRDLEPTIVRFEELSE
jgi:alpha-D-ribose 1-methylphosphonate 5-triphosphate synthase subunit PhnG